MRPAKLILFCLLLTLALGVACVSGTQPGTGAKKTKAAGEPVLIGFSMDTLKEERWQRDKELVEKHAKEVGAQVNVQVANGDDSLQTKQCENLLTQGVDVLIVAPHNGEIAASIVQRGSTLLVTRANEAAYEAVRQNVPGATYYADAAIIGFRQQDVMPGNGNIVVAAAGTSDLSVAEEAARTAELMGNEVSRLYDVGVAGLHRLLSERARLAAARVIIVVAGMEGALPSVVSGLVSVPVIAVPTSVGYGASFGGIAALLGMLNSCATGVAVVNIDNGFGAAAIASLINHL